MIVTRLNGIWIYYGCKKLRIHVQPLSTDGSIFFEMSMKLIPKNLLIPLPVRFPFSVSHILHITHTL